MSLIEEVNSHLASRQTCKKAERGCILKSFKYNNYDDPNCEIQEENLMISNEELKLKIIKKDLIIISLIEDINISLPFHVPTVFLKKMNKYA